MKPLKHLKLSDFIITILLAAVIIVGFIFVGTDIEYNLNQQIARGYISREATFFEIDNPSYTQHVMLYTEADINGNVLDFYITEGVDYSISEDGVIEFDNSNIEAQDADFILENSINDDGVTSIEKLLSSSNNKNYFASLHSGMLRGVYYTGNIELPPLTSGRFITYDECLGRNPVAVIGNNYIDDIYEENNKKYFDYLNKKYEVIGIAGLSGSSPLDSMIFVNIGSLTPDEQLNGIFYIDSSTDNISIFEEFCTHSYDLLGCGLKQRGIPEAAIDTVSGGMYLKDYLKYIMIGLFIFTFANILIQHLRQHRSKIATLKVLGISNARILITTVKRSAVEQVLGILIGTLTVLVLILTEYFSLPVRNLVILSSKLIACGLVLLFTWILANGLVIILTNPKEVIQRI